MHDDAHSISSTHKIFLSIARCSADSPPSTTHPSSNCSVSLFLSLPNHSRLAHSISSTHKIFLSITRCSADSPPSTTHPSSNCSVSLFLPLPNHSRLIRPPTVHFSVHVRLIRTLSPHSCAAHQDPFSNCSPNSPPSTTFLQSFCKSVPFSSCKSILFSS